MGRRLHALHRGCGLVAAIGALWLALTGALLQLAPVMRWDRAALPDTLAQTFYPSSSGHGAVVVAGSHRLSGDARAWRFDARALDQPPGAPRALAPLADLWVGLGSTGLVLLTADGERVEQLAYATIGLSAAQSVRATAGTVCVRDPRGRVVCSDDGSSWRAAGREREVQARGGAWLPLAGDDVDDDTRSPTWERLLQDLHALRFVGPLAPVLGAVVAAALVLLAVTGTLTWLAGRRHRRARAAVAHAHRAGSWRGRVRRGDSAGGRP